MNIFDFTTDKDSDKEYPYKILVYPNITYMRDLEKDSYVVVLRNVIKELNKVRDDIHWTIMSPGDIKSLTFDNTTQIPINLPSYPNAMRCHFNYNEIKANLRWKHTDYDVVYSHLPEHTLQLKNLLVNDTNIDPKIVGYCHWYEVDENTNYSERMLLHNYNGMLRMEECGVNSVWLKELVLSKACDIFSGQIIHKLDKIIQPHYLGIDKINNIEVPTKKKTIIFNHRDNYYTGWTWFIDSMDELYKQRQDFTVYTTLADLDRPYAKRVRISDRDEYLDFIRSMHVGVGTFQKYSAWSISTTDSLSMGVPYILPNKLCYPEMVGKDYPLLYEGRDEFLQRLNGALDDDGSVDKAKTYLKTKIQEFPWASRVPQWFNGWNFLQPDAFDMIGDKSESYTKIVDFIHKKKSVTKKEILDFLGWGVRISFSSYRNKLRTEDTIRFTKDRYEVI